MRTSPTTPTMVVQGLFGAVLTRANMVRKRPASGTHLIFVADPRLAFADAAWLFYPEVAEPLGLDEGQFVAGEACRIASERLKNGTGGISDQARELMVLLQREVPGLVLVGHPTDRLPNTLNVLFPGVSGRRVLEACPGVLASTGSACHADREDPSAILLALGIAPDAALGAVRLSLGHSTTKSDIATAADRLAAAWRAVAQPARTAAE